jgi:small subunit ribosomal protein S21
MYHHLYSLSHTLSPHLSAPSTTELAVKIKVEVGNGEPIESALRRFKKEVNKSSHLMELRHRRYFENSQDKIKRKKKEAGMRRKFERMQRKRMQRV